MFPSQVPVLFMKTRLKWILLAASLFGKFVANPFKPSKFTLNSESKFHSYNLFQNCHQNTMRIHKL